MNFIDCGGPKLWMWTEQSCGRMAKKPKRYQSDLTDEEGAEIASLMPKPRCRGRPRAVEFREVINTVRHLVRSGCVWRILPVHFGPRQTVYAGSGNWRGDSRSRQFNKKAGRSYKVGVDPQAIGGAWGMALVATYAGASA